MKNFVVVAAEISWVIMEWRCGKLHLRELRSAIHFRRSLEISPMSYAQSIAVQIFSAVTGSGG